MSDTQASTGVSGGVLLTPHQIGAQREIQGAFHGDGAICQAVGRLDERTLLVVDRPPAPRR
ncbi:MAG: hypothetical protein R3B07_02860 [Polyangiaceae bacterium]